LAITQYGQKAVVYISMRLIANPATHGRNPEDEAARSRLQARRMNTA
jgi:hypothetical protein